MTELRQVTLTELARETGDVIVWAESAPVVITRHGMASHVLLSADEYRRLAEVAQCDD